MLSNVSKSDWINNVGLIERIFLLYILVSTYRPPWRIRQRWFNNFRFLTAEYIGSEEEGREVEGSTRCQSSRSISKGPEEMRRRKPCRPSTSFFCGWGAPISQRCLLEGWRRFWSVARSLLCWPRASGGCPKRIRLEFLLIETMNHINKMCPELYSNWRWIKWKYLLYLMLIGGAAVC